MGGTLFSFAEGKMERLNERVRQRGVQLQEVGDGDSIEARGLRLLNLQRKLRERVVACNPMAGLPSVDSIRYLSCKDIP